MLQGTFLFLGLLALVASIGTMRPRLDTPTRVIAGAFGTFAWTYWSISALSIQATTDATSSGLTEPVSYLGLTALGLAAAATLLLSTARLAFGSIGTTYNQAAPLNND